jgi:sodium transport system permease protein
VNFNHIRIVWRKELLDTIRDRRTLIMMIVVPLALMPLLVLGPNLLRLSEEEKKQQQVQEIVVVNGQDAPELVALIRGSGLLRIVEIEDPEGALREGEIDAVLVLPQSFSQLLDSDGDGDPPEIALLFDAARSDSRAAREKLSQLLEAYRERLVTERLRERGLPPEILIPFATQERSVASEERLSGFFLSLLLPLFLVLWAAVGGSQTAIDVSAGEKERGTLESLLVTPPKRSSLVIGKFLAVTAVTLGATTLSRVGFALSLTLGGLIFPESPFFSVFGFAVRPGTLALLFAVMALLSAMMSAVTFALYTWTRNFKEAQTYASYLSFVVIIPGFMVMFADPPASSTALLIPVYNAAMVLKELLLGEIRWDHLLVTLLSSLVYLALSLGLAVRIFRNERALFRQ